jgi:hypothetical protein
MRFANINYPLIYSLLAYIRFRIGLIEAYIKLNVIININPQLISPDDNTNLTILLNLIGIKLLTLHCFIIYV